MEESISSADELLLNAADSGDVAALTKALAEGADVNARDQYRRTALMLAARRGRPAACLEILINAGADIEAVAMQEKTAVMYAYNCPWLDALYVLMAAGCNLDMVLSREVTAEKERRAILAEMSAPPETKVRTSMRI